MEQYGPKISLWGHWNTLWTIVSCCCGMQIEWQESLTSIWWWSPACDCLSIQLQMNELTGFDAAAGHMPAVLLRVWVCVWELMQSEIGRNTGITGRSGLSDEMDARVLQGRSSLTHIHSVWGARPRRPEAPPPCFTVHRHIDARMWVHARGPKRVWMPTYATRLLNCTQPTGQRSNQQD